LKRPRLAEGHAFSWKYKQILIQVSFNTNDYCDKFENNSDLKIFPKASAGHAKRCDGPHVAAGRYLPTPVLEKRCEKVCGSIKHYTD